MTLFFVWATMQKESPSAVVFKRNVQSMSSFLLPCSTPQCRGCRVKTAISDTNSYPSLLLQLEPVNTPKLTGGEQS